MTDRPDAAPSLTPDRRAILTASAAALAMLAAPTAARAAKPRRWSASARAAGAGGGTLVGNPDAPVKLAEYLSFTCGHCGAFTRTSAPALYRDYIDGGGVSMEYRNLLRDPIDLAAALLARVDGHAGFSGHLHALMRQQDAWLARAAALPDRVTDAWYSGPMPQRLAAIVRDLGLDRLMAARKVKPARIRAVLANQALQDELIAMTNVGIDRHGVTGTPTFLMNGVTLDGVHDWPTLKSRLDGLSKTA